MLLVACGSADTLRTETGLVVAIDGIRLGQVDGFTLRTPDGRTVDFDTRETRFDTIGFPPTHLHEHRALAEPIRVTYQERDGVRRVLRLEDAER